MTTPCRSLAGCLVLVLQASTLSAAAPPTPSGRDRYGDPLPRGAVARLGTVRWRHDQTRTYGPQPQLIFSPDGRELLAEGDKGLRRWDVSTGRLLPWLPRVARTQVMRLLPDGKTLVTATQEVQSDEGKDRPNRWYIERWRWGEATPLNRVNLPVSNQHNPFEQALLSRDGKLLVTWDFAEKVMLWDAVTGRRLRVIDRTGSRLAGLTLTPDGKHLILLSYRRGLHVYDTTTGKHVQTLVADAPQEDSLHSYWAPRVSPDGRLLVLSGRRHLELWDWRGGKRLARCDGVYGQVAFSPDGRWVACATPLAIQLLEARTLKVVRVFEPHREAWGPDLIAFSADGKRLALGGAHSTTLWDVTTGKCLPGPAGHLGAVGALAFSRDGRRLASGGTDGTAYVWDLATKRPLHVFPGHHLSVAGVAFSPDGRLLATGEQGGWATREREGLVRLYDLSTGRLVRRFPGHLGAVHGLVFSADGKRIATAGPDERIRVWDVANGTRLAQIRHLPLDSRPVSFLSGGRSLLIQHQGRTCLSDIDTATFSSRGVGPSHPTSRVAATVVLPGEKQAAVLVSNEVVWYDVANGKRVRVLTLPDSRLDFPCVLSPGAAILACQGDAGAIELWDLVGGKRFTVLSERGVDPAALAFSPDGRWLASAGSDTTILLWDLEQLRREYALAELSAGRGDLRLLTAYPQDGVAAVMARLRKAADTERQVRRLIKDLDDENFAVREKASTALEKLGAEAAPGLQRAAKTGTSVEVRTRARRILSRIDKDALEKAFGPSQVRAAVGLLAKLGTPQALRALENLARLTRGTLVGDEASRAVQQMRKRGSPR